MLLQIYTISKDIRTILYSVKFILTLPTHLRNASVYKSAGRHSGHSGTQRSASPCPPWFILTHRKLKN
jgi:hypothetical protein